MTKRMISMLAAVAVVIAALAVVKFHQIKVAIAQASSFQPPPEAVTTVVARREAWPDTLEAIGSVAAVQGVTVAADLPGLVDHIAIDSGRMVRAGEELVELDTRQEKAQMAAALAQGDLGRLNLERARGPAGEGVGVQADDDR